MEAQLKGAVLIAVVVVPPWRCPILKPLSAKLPPKSETAPHSEWQNGKILGPGLDKIQKNSSIFGMSSFTPSNIFVTVTKIQGVFFQLVPPNKF